MAARAWTLAPYVADASRRRALARWGRGTSSAKRKVAVLAGSAGAAAALALAGRRRAAVVALAPAAALVGPIARERLERRLKAWTVGRRLHTPSTLPPAAASLVALGVSQDVADRVCEAASARGAYRVGRFDQRNRLCSDIGEIPGFGVQVVDADEFVPRIMHRVDLVVVSGVLCVRKTYRYSLNYAKEAHALDALRDVPGVPRIVEARPRERVLTQTFLHGVNLATLLGARGFDDEAQHLLSHDHVAWPDWREPDHVPSRRTEALAHLAQVVGPGFVEALAMQLEAMHHAGVVFRDVKYGNVLVRDGLPVWCDFDGCRVYARRGPTLMRDRIVDHDKVNFWFGATLPTERGVRAALSESGGEALVSLVLDGHATSVPDAGWWHVPRAVGVPVRGARVLVVGGRTGLPAAELARRGADVSVTHASSDVRAQAEALARWFDLVDDREEMLATFDVGDHASFDVACAPTALSELDGEAFGAAAAVLALAPVIVVESQEGSVAALDQLSATLGARGFVPGAPTRVSGRPGLSLALRRTA